MGILSCTVKKEIKDKFDKKAQSFGISSATYLRNIVQADLKRSEDMLSLKDLQKCIVAIIPAFVEAIGRSQKATQQQREALKKLCLKTWKEYLQNEEIPSS